MPVFRVLHCKRIWWLIVLLGIFIVPISLFAKERVSADLLQARDLFKHDKYAAAETYYRKAIKYYKLKDERYTLLNANNELAQVLQRAGKEQEAEDFLIANEKEIKKFFPNSILLASCYDILGELRYYVSDVERSADYFKSSYLLKKKLLAANDARLAFSLSNMGRYFNYTQELDSALIYTQKAVSIIENHPVNLEMANAQQIYCEYAYAIKEVYRLKVTLASRTLAFRQYYQSQVRPVYFKALNLNIKLGDSQYWKAYILHYLGNSYTDVITRNNSKVDFTHRPVWEKRYYQQAIRYYNQSVHIQKQLLPQNNPKLAMTYYVMALVNDYIGKNPAVSLDFCQKSLAQIVPGFKPHALTSLPHGQKIYNIHLALSVISYKIQSYYKLFDKYQGLAEANAILKHTDYILAVRLKLMQIYKLNKTADVHTYYYRIPFQYALDVCYRMQRLFPKAKYAEQSLKYFEWSKYSSFIKKALNLYNNELDLVAKINRDVVNLDKLRLTMPADMAVIEFFDDEEFLYSLYFDKNQQLLARIPFSKTEQENLKVQLSHIDQMSEQEYKNFAFNLYKKMLGNFPLKSSVKNIRIVPGNYFSHLIPFDALIKSNAGNSFKNFSYLIRSYQISYSLSIMVDYLNDKYTGKVINHHGLFVAPVNPHFSTLAFSDQFVKDQVSGSENKVLFGAAANAKSLSRMNNYNVIHLATHSFANAQKSDSSYLVFSDRKVFLPELFKYRLNSNLVNLAACETTLGKSSSHNGSTMSFVRAFTYTGAQAITSTLWKVDDQMTAQIYTYFFHALRSGKDKSGALRESKLRYLQENARHAAHPYYWAGVVVYGKNDPVYQKPFLEKIYRAIQTGLIMVSTELLWK